MARAFPPWQYLPYDCLSEILQHVEYPDVCRAAMVCRNWHPCLEDGLLWRVLTLRRWAFVPIERYNFNWPRCFRERHMLSRKFLGGRPTVDYKLVTCRGHTSYINCFQLCRGRVVSGAADTTLRVFGIYEGTPSAVVLEGHDGPVECVAYNGGEEVCSGSEDGTVRVWDVATGAQRIVLAPPHHPPRGTIVRLLQRENDVLSGGTDRLLRVWDPRTGQCTLEYEHPSAIGEMVQGRETGQILVGGSGGQVCTVDLRTARAVQALQCHRGPITALRLTPDGNTILSASALDRQINTWNARTGSSLAHQSLDVTCVSCDNKRAALGASSGEVMMWPFADGRPTPIHLRNHCGPVHGVQFDDMGKLVSCSADNSCLVYDLNKAAKLYALLGGSMQARGGQVPHPARPGCSGVQFDEGRIVCSVGSLLRVWNFD